LLRKPKGDPDKLVMAVRLRKETTLTTRQIAQRLQMGSWKSLRNKLCLRNKAEAEKREYDNGTV
jgi:hypothetical protein